MDDLLLHDVIHASAERTPDRAAVSHRDRVLTFAQVAEQTTRLAAALAARGVRPGGRVAWWGETTPDVVALYFVAAQAGAVFVPLNPGGRRRARRPWCSTSPIRTWSSPTGPTAAT